MPLGDEVAIIGGTRTPTLELTLSLEPDLKVANDLLKRAQEEKSAASDHMAELEKELAGLKAAPVEVAVMAATPRGTALPSPPAGTARSAGSPRRRWPCGSGSPR